MILSGFYFTQTLVMLHMFWAIWNNHGNRSSMFDERHQRYNTFLSRNIRKLISSVSDRDVTPTRWNIAPARYHTCHTIPLYNIRWLYFNQSYGECIQYPRRPRRHNRARRKRNYRIERHRPSVRWTNWTTSRAWRHRVLNRVHRRDASAHLRLQGASRSLSAIRTPHCRGRNEKTLHFRFSIFNSLLHQLDELHAHMYARRRTSNTYLPNRLTHAAVSIQH